MKIYLSGSVEEVFYRKYVKTNYSHLFEIKDPLSEVEDRLNLDVEGYRSGKIDFSTDIVNNIVEGDIKLLRDCDVLVAMMIRYSAGTIMEIRAAYDMDKPIYLIDPNETMRRDIWLRYHANAFFDRIADCFGFLKTLG